MPRALPANSRPRSARPTLIVALSGRALAAAARRARQATIVVDAFGDLDTRGFADACVTLPFGPDGFDPDRLCAAVAAQRRRVAGLVYGAGFEHCPALLAELGRLVPIIGNRPEVVAAVKDPIRLAALLAQIGAPHPPISLAPPRGEGWLAKRIGGSGGGHIRDASGTRPGPDTYYQRRVRGRPISALFLADGTAARIVGHTEQWTDGTAQASYRFGGCAGPIHLPDRLAAAIERTCSALAASTGLVGLNGLDLLVEGEDYRVLEVNPRPGASLDIFDGAGGLGLWRLHRRAIEGRLPPLRARARSARAAAVLYAPDTLAMPAGLVWPDWTADRGRPGTVVRRDQPICTIRASAATASAARDRVAARAGRLLERFADCRVP